MAIKEIKTRVALRTGDYAYWTTGAGKDIELYKGEVCICTVAKADDQATTAPTVLFKVADANGKKFADLDWCSAKAADVYDWAKKSQEDFITWVNTVVEHPANPVITTGAANGTISVDGTDVAVKGLGSAAYTDSTAYATSTENGAKQAAADAQKTIDDYVEAHKNDYTNKQIDDAIAAVDTGVHSVALAGGTNNGTVKLTVDGAATDNIAVTGLQSAAYVTVESLNATAKGYADAVEAKLPTSADYGVLEVKAGTGIEVTGDAQRPVVGVKANTYDAYGSAAQALEDAKKYADAKPHENTAHTHSAGAGLAVTGNGGIDGNVSYELNIAFELVDKTIKLYDKADSSKTAIATLDATEFIADGMLSSVTADQANNKLVFEWNTDAGVTKTEIPLDSIADIYTGSTGAEVNVAVSNTNVISASLNSEVAAKVANGATAYGWGDHSKAGYAKEADLGDLAVKDKIVEGDIDGTIAASKISGLGALAAKNTIATADIDNDAVTADKIADAVMAEINKAHTHANKTELDKFADGDKAKLDSALQSVSNADASITVGTKTANNQTIKVNVSADSDNDIELKADGLKVAKYVGKKSVDITGNEENHTNVVIDGHEIGLNNNLRVDSVSCRNYQTCGITFEETGTDTCKTIIKGNKVVIEGYGNTINNLDATDSLSVGGKAVATEEFVINKQYLTGVAAGTGLKVSAKADNSQTIDIDDEVIFVLNCNY